MIIRPATAEDVPEVIPLVEKICGFHEARDPQRYAFVPGAPEMYRGWLTRRAADADSVFLVAQRPASAGQPARIVGFLVADSERDLSIYRHNRIGFIHDVWVDPAYRNEGVARQLVMQTIERFKQIGVDQIRMDVLVDNTPARGLFESCGFRPSTVQMLYPLSD